MDMRCALFLHEYREDNQTRNPWHLGWVWNRVIGYEISFFFSGFGTDEITINTCYQTELPDYAYPFTRLYTRIFNFNFYLF